MIVICFLFCFIGSAFAADSVCAYNTTGSTYITTQFPFGPPKYCPDCAVTSTFSCGCPNNCFNFLGRGVCSNKQCACYEGWSGEDCSLVDCAYSGKNNCSGHGKCHKKRDLCTCDPGFAYNDCSASEVFSFAPIIQTLNGSVYSKKDIYGDEHPVFNESTIAQIFITMNEDDLLFLQEPANEYNRDYKDILVDFNNGNIDLKSSKGGIRVMGDWSRRFAKKSWKVELYKDDWYVKGFSLKSAAFEPSFVREKMSMALLHSLVSPVYRGSYATVWINDQYFGLFLLLESADDDFLESRFGNKDGEFYKCFGNFEYHGNNASDYKGYEAENIAAQNYTKLINLFQMIQQNISNIGEMIDVSSIIRVMVMEAATSAWARASPTSFSFRFSWLS
eukprot:TRINITY_DN7495_c0_g1_i2.p1 TRINITY_DN7495_c0_g1~~TRINITY_DN7495_c0_g1_i2.p1  ORF type:complete len:390 (+),score=60.11 TRINITY_DN7495_c0_g1_i2:97-1266(+)